MSSSSPVHVVEPFFWIGQLLDTLRLKAQAIFDGSNCNADPHELQVTLRNVYFTMMLFGCMRAVCELKGIYNV